MINVPKKNTTGRRLEPRPAISDELKKLGKAKLYTLKGEEREEMINLRTPLGVGITIPDMFHCYTVGELNDHIKENKIPRSSSYTSKEMAIEAIYDYYNPDARAVEEENGSDASEEVFEPINGFEEGTSGVTESNGSPERPTSRVTRSRSVRDEFSEPVPVPEEPKKKRYRSFSYNPDPNNLASVSSLNNVTTSFDDADTITINVNNPLNCTFNFH